MAAPASATLNLLQPDPDVPATFTGKAGFSTDGLGQGSPGGSVQADVPSGSTVERAYLYGTYAFNANPNASARTIDFDGTNVELAFLPNSEPGPCCSLATARAEVTNQVKTKVGSGGGITDFVIGNDPSSLDGVALVVIYSNPALPVRSIAVLDGGSKQSGDSATVNLQDPINKSAADFASILALGSGFSFQGASGNACAGGQFSTVDVNGDRLTSCAGNFDDGEPANGALITVGGVGDSTANPADPNSSSSGTDDELYDLAPLLEDGDTQIRIDTTNPSGDDNLFLAVFQVPGRASVVLEGPFESPTCSDGIDNDGDGQVDGGDEGCSPVEGPPGDASCADFADNDGDGKTDQSDADCQSPEGPAGDASCSDGVDNDGDGKTDASDSQCQSSGGSDQLVGLTRQGGSGNVQKLRFFAADAPATVVDRPITGVPSNQQLIGIDSRPATGELFGVSRRFGTRQLRLYRIDPASGAATPVGLVSSTLGFGFAGVDFNPTVDRLRVVNTDDRNGRINPAGGSALNDGSLAYAGGDPNAGVNPRVVGSAYTNNTDGATSTKLYGIDDATDSLVLQDPPNAGTLQTVGELGTTLTPELGFDVSGATGTAYAAIRPIRGKSQLRTVDLSTGKASLVGQIGNGQILEGLAVIAGGTPAE